MYVCLSQERRKFLKTITNEAGIDMCGIFEASQTQMVWPAHWRLPARYGYYHWFNETSLPGTDNSFPCKHTTPTQQARQTLTHACGLFSPLRSVQLRRKPT